MRRIAVVGMGAVGARVARQLIATHPRLEVVVTDIDHDRLRSVARNLGPAAIVAETTDGGRLGLDRPAFDREACVRFGIDLVVVAAAAGRHVGSVRAALAAGVPAISTSDRLDDVRALARLDPIARSRGVAVLAGVGFAPGLTGLLARHGAAAFEVVDEIHVAKVGTGGPSCARQHHRALNSAALDWRDGEWRRRPGGSGRELVWFPEPVGGADCYRGALPDAFLLQPWFPDATRITARIAASRQDRFTSWLPMLTPPHPEGGVGAIRVELRGRIGREYHTEVLGAVERPAIAAATVAAVAADLIAEDRAGGPGVRGLAGVDDARAALSVLARRGLTGQRFEGLSA